MGAWPPGGPVNGCVSLVPRRLHHFACNKWIPSPISLQGPCGLRSGVMGKPRRVDGMQQKLRLPLVPQCGGRCQCKGSQTFQRLLPKTQMVGTVELLRKIRAAQTNKSPSCEQRAWQLSHCIHW